MRRGEGENVEDIQRRRGKRMGKRRGKEGRWADRGEEMKMDDLKMVG